MPLLPSADRAWRVGLARVPFFVLAGALGVALFRFPREYRLLSILLFVLITLILEITANTHPSRRAPDQNRIQAFAESMGPTWLGGTLAAQRSSVPPASEAQS